MKPSASRLLFSFVTVAYAMSITDVFPVMYETAKMAWHYLRGMPPPSTLLWGSVDHWSNLTPFLDKGALVLVVFLVWVAYFFLMCGIGSIAKYNPGHALWDIGQALVLYAAAQSVQDVDTRNLVESDTTWILLGVAFFACGVRAMHACLTPRLIGTGAEARRLQDARSMLLSVSHGSLALMSLCVWGYLYERSALDLRQLVATGACAAATYVISIGLLWAILMAKRCMERRAEFIPDDWGDGWEWIWRTQRSYAICGLALVVTMLLGAVIAWEHVFSALLRYRAALPHGVLLLGAACTVLGIVFRAHVRTMLLAENRDTVVLDALRIIVGYALRHHHASISAYLYVVGRGSVSHPERIAKVGRSRNVDDSDLDVVVRDVAAMRTEMIVSAEGVARVRTVGMDAGTEIEARRNRHTKAAHRQCTPYVAVPGLIEPGGEVGRVVGIILVRFEKGDRELACGSEMHQVIIGAGQTLAREYLVSAEPAGTARESGSEEGEEEGGDLAQPIV